MANPRRARSTNRLCGHQHLSRSQYGSTASVVGPLIRPDAADGIRDSPRRALDVRPHARPESLYAAGLSGRHRAICEHGQRKIFISRANANYRRLENEADVERLVAAYGYEIVRLEELTFAAQLRLFSEAKVVLSLHGAGLANIIYSPTSTHVVEIIDPSFPNPEYFDLATAMGHFYWMVKGSPVGEPRPGYHDIRVDVSDLEQTLTQVSDKAGETSEIGT